MALADILQALDAEAAAQIGQIEAEAKCSVAQIRSAADDDARAIHERHLREIQTPLQQGRARRLNQARMAARSSIGQARERLFADALQRAREQLAGLRGDPRYPAILRILVEEAGAQLSGEIVLRADQRDEAALHALFPDIRIECDLHSWGGVAATTTDRRIAVINTLEARLEQAHDLLQQAVMPLFEEESDDIWLTTTMPMHDFVR
jgi:vacuolar-type H+-ATPase subunit E/Vma4